MDYFDQIQNYLNKKLAEEQIKAFEKERTTNPELARAVRLDDATNMVYEAILEEEITRQIHIAARRSSRRYHLLRKVDIPYRRAMAIAASILLLVFSCVGYYANTHVTNKALVYAYVDLPNLSGVRGDTRAFDPVAPAVIYFSREKYQSCVALLSEMSREDQGYQKARLILGYSYLMLERPSPAIQAFRNMLDTTFPEKNRTEWHYMLAHLLANDIEDVEHLLDTILLDPNHDYYREAQELDNYLKSAWRKLVF